MSGGVLQRAYGRITGDPEVRVTDGIEEQARGAVPASFFLQLAASVASKLGDSLSDTKLVLAWLLQAVGAPSAAVAALVPVREAGSLVPQLVMSGLLRSRAYRKRFWIGGAVVQGGCVAAIGTLALVAPGPRLGWPVVALIAIFAIGRSACSISSKDLLGKTVPRTRRGRLAGLASSAAGAVTLVVGLAFLLGGGRSLVPRDLAVLLFGAAACWAVASVAMGRVPEHPGETEDGDPLRGALDGFRHLTADRDFRNFCIARALLASTILSFPFYVVLAQEATGGRLSSLGLLIIASAGSTALSGTVWGWMADRSSRRTIAVAGTAAGLIGCLTVLVSGLEMGPSVALWVYGGLFFLVGLAHTGIRLGRKTYVVDVATAENRATYVAVSNTLIGGVLLLSGSFGVLAPWIGERGVILVFALLGLVGGGLAWLLREVETGP